LLNALNRPPTQTSLHIGDQLYSGDGLQTLTNSTAGIIFEDNTVLSLGPDTEINIKDYVFAPENSLFSMIIDMFHGTASYFSGIIGQQAPGEVRVRPIISQTCMSSTEKVTISS
jgi:hypothetical protein